MKFVIHHYYVLALCFLILGVMFLGNSFVGLAPYRARECTFVNAVQDPRDGRYYTCGFGTCEINCDDKSNTLDYSSDKKSIKFYDGRGGATPDDVTGTHEYTLIIGSASELVVRLKGAKDSAWFQRLNIPVTVYGGEGNDNIQGGSGDDTLYGELDHDIITGNNGNDYIRGGKGKDNLDGGDSDDVICSDEDADIGKGGGFGEDFVAGGPDETNDVVSKDELDSFGIAMGDKPVNQLAIEDIVKGCRIPQNCMVDGPPKGMKLSFDPCAVGATPIHTGAVGINFVPVVASGSINNQQIVPEI